MASTFVPNLSTIIPILPRIAPIPPVIQPCAGEKNEEFAFMFLYSLKSVLDRPDISLHETGERAKPCRVVPAKKMETKRSILPDKDVLFIQFCEQHWPVWQA